MDCEVHRETFVVWANCGINRLQFRGYGTSDGYGASLDNIALYREIPYGYVAPSPKHQPLIYKTNPVVRSC